MSYTVKNKSHGTSSGRATGKIIGSCEFRIPVSKAELILNEEIRTLSVFKHILTTVPADNRWYPLMQRYVHHLGLRVDALGGDATTVHPNPNGSGQPYDPHGDRPTTDSGGEQPGTGLETLQDWCARSFTIATDGSRDSCLILAAPKDASRLASQRSKIWFSAPAANARS